MGDKVLGGQGLVVDGSKSGAVHVKSKNAYTESLLLEYAGETKSGASDRDRGWYIEKLVYNDVLSLEEILIAQNSSTAGCTSVSIATVKNTITITALNGDFSEALSEDTINLTVTDSTAKVLTCEIKRISDTVLEINLNKFP